MAVAVAVDLGASSIRSAVARFEGGKISVKLLDQRPNGPVGIERLTWDFPAILDFSRGAAEIAGSLGATVGIDGWGVDHGFLDASGQLAQPVVAYRDRSHEATFRGFDTQRNHLYRLTGTQHQPFNTFYQLVARRVENPGLHEWLLLPDLVAYFLAGVRCYEATNASTTQLVGLDGSWCHEAFALAGWEPPENVPTPPGAIVGRCDSGAPLALVATHDTASAVAGLGRLGPGEAFLNMGSWSLLGCLVDHPVVDPLGEVGGYTNERAHDGRIRLLANVPGTYVLKRLHEEVGGDIPFDLWIAGADGWPEAAPLMERRFFNPPSMAAALAEGLTRPRTPAGWAGLGVASILEAVRTRLEILQSITGRAIERLRVSGGATASGLLMRRLEAAVDREVLLGPAESTALGNAAVQFVAQGAIPDWEEMAAVVERSVDWREVRA